MWNTIATRVVLHERNGWSRDSVFLHHIFYFILLRIGNAVCITNCKKLYYLREPCLKQNHPGECGPVNFDRKNCANTVLPILWPRIYKTWKYPFVTRILLHAQSMILLKQNLFLNNLAVNRVVFTWMLFPTLEMDW